MGGGGPVGKPITKLRTLRGLADKKIRELEESEQTYDLFISHSWKYDSDYENLKKLLEGVDDFNFRDYSVPKDKPLDAKNSAELYHALEKQIKTTSVVVITAGMYANHSEWIEKEVEIGKNFGKPIVVVVPWGSRKTPVFLQENANAIVGWNRYSISNAIRELRK